MSFDDVIREAITNIANKIIDEVSKDRALMNKKQLTEYLGQSNNTIDSYYLNHDDFPVLNTGSKNDMYPRKAVDEWIEKHTKTRKEIR
ncbi:hypothetical protein R4B61_00485 [Fructilactobacillus vespulae]|uniref:hypothetical protein n=1 Tax=Fructilactobacillus vespulae TaxID=1249630 RepID=UPI0039B5F01D